jgi:hypothetical protein
VLRKARNLKNDVLGAKLIILHAGDDVSGGKSSELARIGRAKLDEFTSNSARFGAQSRALLADADRYPPNEAWIRKITRCEFSKNECAEAV